MADDHGDSGPGLLGAGQILEGTILGRTLTQRIDLLERLPLPWQADEYAVVRAANGEPVAACHNPAVADLVARAVTAFASP